MRDSLQASSTKQSSGERRTNGERRKPNRSRRAQLGNDVKKTRIGEEGANEDMDEEVGLDLPCAREAHRAARVTRAGDGGGDMLHFVP